MSGDVCGIDADGAYGCKHYSSPLDIVAILCPCCKKYYACHLCHEELSSRPIKKRAVSEFSLKAILCRRCGGTLTIAEYLSCQDRCPKCKALFNPGCKLHKNLYFEKK